MVWPGKFSRKLLKEKPSFQIISGKKIATGVGILQDLQAFQFELQIHSVMRQKVSTVIVILVQELVVEALTIQKLGWILQVSSSVYNRVHTQIFFTAAIGGRRRSGRKVFAHCYARGCD